MQFHEVASIFPMMSVEEFKALKESIQARGQRNPIYTHEGKIVDGRNRYQACTELGITPHFAEWDGKGLLVDFVWDLNAGRRQLTGGALHIAAGKYAVARENEARQRQGTNKANKAFTGSNLDSIESEFEYGRSRQMAADKFGVGSSTVQRAQRVVKYGAPELVQAVESGKLSVNAAYPIAKLPVERQKEAVTRGLTKPAIQKSEEPQNNGEIKPLGVGIDRAHEAINCLRRIPKNDGLRKRGFQIVADWIKQNL